MPFALPTPCCAMRSPHWTHDVAAETSVPAESLRNTLPIELQLPNGR
jgi:hypothetical protein